MGRPDFIGVGVARCGTTSLYQSMCMHPQIHRGRRKEVSFFDRFFHKGLDWYLEQLPGVPDGHITGEFSPDYFYEPDVPARIKRFFPDAKLILMLRDPVESCYSYYWFGKVAHSRFSYDFATAIQEDPQNMIGRRFYDTQLRFWLECFDLDQFHIIRSEDFFENPQAVMSDLFELLGVEDREVNFVQLGHKLRDGRPVPPESREILEEIFEPHNKNLEEMTGRSFWDYG